jgi:CRP-like cAMP-binding protein
MEQLKYAIQQMINITETELEAFLSKCFIKTFAKKENASRPDVVPNGVFFINKGLFRILVTDNEGTEHTIHFALENQFIADYSCFIQKTPSIQTIQALEQTETVVLPRSAIEWAIKICGKVTDWDVLLQNTILFITIIELKINM